MAMRLVLMVCVAALVGSAAGHGRLEEPPSRATSWRYGFKTPPNYQDNELFCGGFSNQQKLGGKCGVCGDPYQANPRPHEAGGKYATGTIVRRYDQDSKMAVRVHLTANHKGWIEFRLCPVNDRKTKATLECLDRNLLTISGTQNTRYVVTTGMRLINVDLDLPEGLTCTQCVLQWKYHAGNSWGTEPNGKGCIGCGPQEEFYGCSDIAIDATAGGRPRTLPPVRKTTPRHPTQPTRRQTTPQHPTQPTRRLTRPPPRRTSMPPAWKTTAPPKKRVTTPVDIPTEWCEYECCAVGVWKKHVRMNEWCMNNCSRGYCPPSHCICLI